MARLGCSSVSLFRSGITCRCPRCGRGHLFSGYLTVVDQCASCGLEFQGQDAADGPAVFVILILGFVVVGGAALFEVTVGPPMWLHLLIWTPTIIGGSIFLLRPFKSLMIALHFKYGLLRTTDSDEGA